MAEKHTPTPWHTGGISNPTTDPRYNLWGPTPAGAQSGECVAKSISPCNAKFICRAVNSHAALVEALKRIIRDRGERDKVFATASMALLEAGEEVPDERLAKGE